MRIQSVEFQEKDQILTRDIARERWGRRLCGLLSFRGLALGTISRRRQEENDSQSQSGRPTEPDTTADLEPTHGAAHCNFLTRRAIDAKVVSERGDVASLISNGPRYPPP